MSDLISRQAAIKAACEGFCHPGIACPDCGCKELDPIKAVPAVSQWIPCKERMPNYAGRYLVTKNEWGKWQVDWDVWTNNLQWLYSVHVVA